MTQSVADDEDSKWHILSFFQAQLSMSGIQPSLSALMKISHKECRQRTHNASISPISVCTVFENKDKIVIVMEYASKGELYDYISERRKLGERETRHFFRQIVSAVHYCHKVRSQALMWPLSPLLHIHVQMHKKKKQAQQTHWFKTELFALFHDSNKSKLTISRPVFYFPHEQNVEFSPFWLVREISTAYQLVPFTHEI